MHILRWTVFLPLVWILLAVLGWSAPQADPVTSVDVYGARALDEEALRAAIGVEAGQALDEDTDAIRERVEALPGVARAEVARIRYPGNHALFVGVEEEGAQALDFDPAPTGEARLDAELIARCSEAGDLLMPAIRANQATEDTDAGHSLSHYAPLREIQLGFVAVADARFDEIAEVLATSADARSRSCAATILAYAGDKPRAAAALQRAARDPDQGTRNNAVRALSILARFGYENPDAGVEIDPAPFLALIESVVWTDRNKGAAALESMTASRDPKLLAALRARSLPALAEMARWQSPGHAGFALKALGRVAGEEEEALQARTRAVYGDHAARIALVDELLQRAASAK